MNFTSLYFLIFFLISLGFYYSLKHKYQNLYLLLASYYLYSQIDYRYSFLLGTTTLIVYVCVNYIHKVESQSIRYFLLLTGIIYNIFILAFFKYYNFFVESIAILLNKIGFIPNMPLINIAVPVGISFFTFQAISYLVDVFNRKIEPEPNFVNFSLYIAYFPKLLNGPIERGSTLLPQISQKRSVDKNSISQGIELIIIGLVKKIAVADVISQHINAAFGNPTSQSSSALVVSAYLYSILIYCDFSGYIDIVRGISKFFGINLTVNFAQPYFSSSIREFWRRWHITLSTWLRDYLYIPLGGSWCKEIRTGRNLMLTMLLGGLWHGANWTFVLWGGLHGAMLTAEHFWKKFKEKKHCVSDSNFMISYLKPVNIVKKVVSVFAIFNMLTLGWIFFRAETLSSAFLFLKGIIAGDWQQIPEGTFCLVYSLVIVLLLDLPPYFLGKEVFLHKLNLVPRSIIYSICISLVLLTWTADYVPFVYFQF